MRAPPLLLASSLALVACTNPFAADEANRPAPTASPSPTTRAVPEPWPTPKPYDLAADVALRRALAEAHLDHTVATVVDHDVFVLARAYSPVHVQALFDKALTALRNGRLEHLPSRALTVYVVDDDDQYERLCRERFGNGGACLNYLGQWREDTRELLVNQGSGPTTLVHELAHTLLAADMDAAPGWKPPRWLREGIASLFETPVIEGADIHGVTNWRLKYLREAQASPDDKELVHLDALFRMPDDLFAESGPWAASAVARFACQWMDSPGQDRLWKFYHRWKEHAADDATGEASFTAVFGQTPKDADAAWQNYLGSLTPPR